MAQKKYDDTTINEALKLADKVGAKSAADQLGISTSAIYYYRKQTKEVARKTQKVITPLKPEEELKDNENVSFQKGDREYRRGDVYFIHKFTTTGAEIATGRPAIVVSNNRLNSKIDTVEVVFLTTKSRIIAPEHFTVRVTGTLSMVIAEQITTIDKSRLGDFIGTCTPDDMKLLDKALLSSLGLEKYLKPEIGDDIVSHIAALKAERDAYKNIYNELFNRMMSTSK